MDTFQQRARAMRQAKITEACIAGMTAKGCFDFRIEDVAETAGVAKGCIYLHFRSKADLLHSSFEELESRVLIEYRHRLGELPKEVTAAGKLTLMSEILLDCDRRTGGFSQSVFTRLSCSLENLRLEKVSCQVEDLVAGIIKDEMNAGNLKLDISPKALAGLFVECVTSRFVRHLISQTGAQQAAHAAVDFFLRGTELQEKAKV